MERLNNSSEDNNLSVTEESFFDSCCGLFNIDQKEGTDDSTNLALFASQQEINNSPPLIIFANQKENRDDWGYLFKLLISYLEVSPCNRTLRLQALHLATRGLYLSVVLIGIYYFMIWLFIYNTSVGWELDQFLEYF